ncbi:hypothetical protein JW899_00055 [Candidatus Uhrbacteria bacterium]|nr:hypothetical protein [Candidatus Uhrbacteria bacterium]
MFRRIAEKVFEEGTDSCPEGIFTEKRDLLTVRVFFENGKIFVHYMKRQEGDGTWKSVTRMLSGFGKRVFREFFPDL